MTVESATDRSPGRARSPAVERERRLVRAAILLVARGAASRVTVVGVRHGPRLLAEAEDPGANDGLDARAETSVHGVGSIVVEASGD